ncbi:GntR family transcriptional regulator [Lentilactobacillus senioris]|uniref:GntR family transcriptional regulator n=1 Tax=Lentilactobacillus senioris TaxID=931534 RepID=UPI00227FFED2|nr:GntR family transcriptional regulator [Lentilactobacillus senioris]MCY9806008.1 GntR family transcriptional regulator [Lentilactobacillus senioris]
MTIRIPLYQKLENTIIKLIESKVLLPGTKLPSESKLHRDYQMSRITIRRALKDLETSGYIETFQGKGSFVKKREHEVGGMHYFNVYEAIKEMGGQAEVKLASFRLIVDDSLQSIRKKLKINDDDYIYEIKYVTTFDGQAVFFDSVYLPYLRYPQIYQSELANSGLMTLLKHKYKFDGKFHTTSVPVKAAKPGEKNPQEAMRVETSAYELQNGRKEMVLWSRAYSFGELMRYLKQTH